MINGSLAGSLGDRSLRAALVRVRYRVEAWQKARHDIRTTAPIEFQRTPEGNMVVASTPYIESLHETAAGAASRILDRLWHEQAELLLEINIRAAAVVRHNRLGQRETVHHRRFGRGLTIWETAAGRAAQRMDSVVAGCNGVVDLYWGRLSGRHPALKAQSNNPHRSTPQPARITPDERWSSPLAMFPPRLAPCQNPSTVLEEAIEIVVGVPL